MKRLTLVLFAALVVVSCNAAPPMDMAFMRINRWIKSNDLMYSMRNQDKETLFHSMTVMGYKNLDYDMTIEELRRIMIAYEYDALFWDMHERTGFSVPFFFAYFVYEATSNGIESELWRLHWNPGGIKARKGSRVAKYYDDCNGKCNFVSLNNYDDAIRIWGSVINNSRYNKCRSYSTAKDICSCMKRSGYHTDNSHYTRAKIMGEYWTLRKHFPTLVPKTKEW